ncbi:MAG: hypothetical protein QJR14_08625 [Bacillota bacterium]|nr:hypothetical protein [Bacillota bacterium]
MSRAPRVRDGGAAAVRVRLPAELAAELDRLVAEGLCADRAEGVARAVRLYCRQVERRRRAELREGYRAWAELNLRLAQEYTAAD